MRTSAILQSALVFAMLPAFAGDLSHYRDYALGSNLATVAKQAAIDPAKAKTIHSRPALIQDLVWQPVQFGAAAVKAESTQELTFTFYNDELYRIVVSYDRYETEGLTSDDIIEAISAKYGTALKPITPSKTSSGRYGDEERIVGEWQDSEYRFELVHSSFGPSFRLIGVLKRLEGPMKTAMIEARRLDDLEEPQRQAARIATENGEARNKQEKARLANKPKFRP